jgi:hypothetical protein
VDEGERGIGIGAGLDALLAAAEAGDRDRAREHAGLLPDATLLGAVVRAARIGAMPRPRGRRPAGIDALASRDRAHAELGGSGPEVVPGHAGLASFALADASREDDLLGETLELGVRPWVVGLVAFWTRGTRLRTVAALADGRVVGATVPDLRSVDHPTHSAGIVAASIGRSPRDAGSDAPLAWGLVHALEPTAEVDHAGSS